MSKQPTIPKASKDCGNLTQLGKVRPGRAALPAIPKDKKLVTKLVR